MEHIVYNFVDYFIYNRMQVCINFGNNVITGSMTECIGFVVLINPQRACARGLSIVTLFVCLSVCLSG